MKDWQFIQRVLDVLKLCDNGEITDEQGIKKMMRSSTKYMQTMFDNHANLETEERQ